MDHIKTYDEYGEISEGLFGIDFSRQKTFVDPNKKSNFLSHSTIGNLARKFKTTPEEIIKFEDYLKNSIEVMRTQAISKILAKDRNPSTKHQREKEYEFHFRENFPIYSE